MLLRVVSLDNVRYTNWPFRTFVVTRIKNRDPFSQSVWNTNIHRRSLKYRYHMWRMITEDCSSAKVTNASYKMVTKQWQFLWKGNRVETVCNNLIRISEIRTLSKTECKGGHKLLNKDDIAITTLLLAVNAKSSYHILMQYPTALKLRINECNLLRSIHKLRITHQSDEICSRSRTSGPSQKAKVFNFAINTTITPISTDNIFSSSTEFSRKWLNTKLKYLNWDNTKMYSEVMIRRHLVRLGMWLCV